MEIELVSDITMTSEVCGRCLFKLKNRQFEIFSDRIIEGTKPMLTAVNIELDLTDHPRRYDDLNAIWIKGNRYPLSFNEDTLSQGKLADRNGDGVWNGIVHFPKNTKRDVSFKLAFIVDGSFAWEYTYGHYNHTFLLPADSKESYLKLKYDPESDRLVTGDGSSLLIDEWDSYRDLLGEHFSQSEFAYSEAMQLLQAGRMNDAKVRYDAFKKSNPGGREIDDFEYKWAEKLADTDIDVALSYLNEREANDTIAFRKSHFAYLKGEILNLRGHNKRARQEYRKVLKKYNDPEYDNKMVIAYAESGLAQSLLYDSHSDTSKYGLEYMKYLSRSENPFIAHDLVLEELLSYYERNGESGNYRSTINKLLKKKKGNNKLLIRWAEKELEWGNGRQGKEILKTLKSQSKNSTKKRTSNEESQLNDQINILEAVAAYQDENFRGAASYLETIDESSLRGRLKGQYKKMHKALVRKGLINNLED